MSVCPTLRFSPLNWGKGPTALVWGVALNPELTPVRGPEIVGDDLQGVMDSDTGRERSNQCR